MIDSRAPWVSKIRVGDILRSGAGVLRVVRGVTHYKTKTFVAFTIRRCSWTGRCYTILDHASLKSQGFQPTGKRLRLRSNLDREIRAEILESRRPSEIKLHCCDVEGVG